MAHNLTISELITRLEGLRSTYGELSVCVDERMVRGVIHNDLGMKVRTGERHGIFQIETTEPAKPRGLDIEQQLADHEARLDRIDVGLHTLLKRLDSESLK